MINTIISDPFKGKVSKELITKTAKFALEHQKSSLNTEISIVIESDQKLRALNSQFRNIDAPTDVLSFPSDIPELDSDIHYLGDIVISYPKAVEQSQKAGHPIENEIRLLIIHGILHLLGYDHYTEQGKEEMWKVQDQILSALNIKISRLSEE